MGTSTSCATKVTRRTCSRFGPRRRCGCRSTRTTSSSSSAGTSPPCTGCSRPTRRRGWLPWKTKDVKLNPFERSCVGVLTKEKYSATLLMYRINYWLVLMTAVGVATFVYSPRLCRNVFFHYTTGIAAGVALSLLVATYFLQKRLRAGWFSWIMACYSLSLYFLTSMWFNVKQYLLENHINVFGYFVVTGIVSFAIC